MATKEGNQWWDPYETSYRRQFIYQPNSAAEIVLCPTSTSFLDPFSKSGPFGSTVYVKDFCWKPACKPECIRTGTASGQRRNNPHPSQSSHFSPKSFMMWRLPRDAAQSSDYVRFPWKCLPSDGEIRKALTAQYHSTYRCDFVCMPQGHDYIKNAKRELAPKHSKHEVLPPTDTEMRANYCQPKQKPELLQHSFNIHPNVTCPGIVPNVVQRHIHTKRKRSDLTSYSRFFGKRVTDVTTEIMSLPCQELPQLNRILPEEEKEAVKTVLRKDANNKVKVNKLPAVKLNSCSPKRLSSCPGPI